MVENVTWKDIEEYIEKVAEFYSLYDISGVYGIPRGGLIFAVMLSYKMNIPLLTAPCNNCIIIDDIADSGDTLIHYANHRYDNNKYHITTMYRNPKSVVIPDVYMKIKTDNWIVYPWEVNE